MELTTKRLNEKYLLGADITTADGFRIIKVRNRQNFDRFSSLPHQEKKTNFKAWTTWKMALVEIFSNTNKIKGCLMDWVHG